MEIFKVKIDGISKSVLGQYISSALNGDRQIQISKTNAEFLYRSLSDDSLVDVLNASDLNIVDGRGVLWAARYLTLPISNVLPVRVIQVIWQLIYSTAAIVLKPGFIKEPISDAIPGVEAFQLMIEASIKANAGVFIFGASESNLELALKNVRLDYPDLKISGYLNGFDFQKDHSIDPVEEINKTDAKLLIVALGSPRQEYWIRDNIHKLKKVRIAVGEGGTLDRIAHPGQLAPRFINRIGLEWLWRLLFNKRQANSRGRFKRFWNAVPLFILSVVKWKMKHGQAKI